MVKGRSFGFGLGFVPGTNPVFIIVIIAVILFIAFYMKSKNLNVTSKFGSTATGTTNLALVTWGKGYSTTKLPITSSTYWIMYPDTDGKFIAVLSKLPKDNLYAAIASRGKEWYIFTSPSLTNPKWTQSPYKWNVSRILQLKDGRYAGICPDNGYIVISSSLTSPNWAQNGAKGAFNELYQLQDGSFAGTLRGDGPTELWVIKSLDSGIWTQPPVKGAMIQLIEVKEPNGSYSYACIGDKGLIFTATSLTSGTWKQTPGGSLSYLTQLQDGSFLGVGSAAGGGGLWSATSLTTGKWTKVSDIAQAGSRLFEY